MKKIEKPVPNAKSEHLADALEVNAKHKTSFFELLKKHSNLFIAIVGVLIMFIIYFGKDYENRKEKLWMVQRATSQLDATNQEMLKLMTKPLVWSIRADMLRRNSEQINLLILDLVKEKNFQFIHIIAPDGYVLLSTNKGLEGKLIGGNVDSVLLLVRSEMVVIEINDTLYVSAPIFGVDKQIATLIVGYKPEVPNFEDNN
jgi:hypothetical protein